MTLIRAARTTPRLHGAAGRRTLPNRGATRQVRLTRPLRFAQPVTHALLDGRAHRAAPDAATRLVLLGTGGRRQPEGDAVRVRQRRRRRRRRLPRRLRRGRPPPALAGRAHASTTASARTARWCGRCSSPTSTPTTSWTWPTSCMGSWPPHADRRLRPGAGRTADPGVPARRRPPAGLPGRADARASAATVEHLLAGLRLQHQPPHRRRGPHQRHRFGAGARDRRAPGRATSPDIDLGVTRRRQLAERRPRPTMEPVVIYPEDDHGVQVTAILVQHAPVFPAFGFRFDTPHGSVVFSGDTGPCDNVVRLARRRRPARPRGDRRRPPRRSASPACPTTRPSATTCASSHSAPEQVGDDRHAGRRRARSCSRTSCRATASPPTRSGRPGCARTSTARSCAASTSTSSPSGSGTDRASSDGSPDDAGRSDAMCRDLSRCHLVGRALGDRARSSASRKRTARSKIASTSAAPSKK